jgi:hypothetical protein
VSTALFLALALVYLVSIVGIVVAGSIVGPPADAPAGLDERLAVVRSIEDDPPRRRAATAASPGATPYFVRGIRKR